MQEKLNHPSINAQWVAGATTAVILPRITAVNFRWIDCLIYSSKIQQILKYKVKQATPLPCLDKKLNLIINNV